MGAVANSERVSDSQIVQFAEAMQHKSWCVDVSLHPPRALHADSNRTASPDVLMFDCLDWLEDQGVREVSAEVARSLIPRICRKLPQVMGSSFRPTDEKFFHDQGALLANTYKPYKPDSPSPSELAAGVAKLNGLAARLFPDVEERTTVLQFMAHALKEPCKRPQYGLLITGAGGTGKSLLVTALESAFGRRHCWRGNKFESVMDKFSQALPDCLVVTFDDAPIGNPTAIYDKLKFVITAGRVEVETKSVQHRANREVFARVIILTNERKPFDLSDDRRFYVPKFCEHLVSKDESAEYFAELVPWIQDPKNASVIYHWLMSIDLAGFSPTAPGITDTHRAMGLQDDQLAELLKSYVSDGRILHAEEASRYAMRNGFDRPKGADLERALQEVGYAKRRRPRPDKRGYLELWVPAIGKRSRPLNEMEISRIRGAGVAC